MKSRIVPFCISVVFLIPGSFSMPAGTDVGIVRQNADSLRFASHIFHENLKTVQIYREGWELSYPIIELGSDQKLVFSFDFLGGNVGDFSYTFVHCNSSWEPSPLSISDYLDGFPENRIEEYRHSFNTTVRYIHYTLTFPNEYIGFRISGNYVLQVYRNHDPENIVVSQRFAITEERVSIRTEPKRPALTRYRDSGQEIDFTVSYQGYPIRDPYRDIRVVVCQNNRWDNAVSDLKPVFLRSSALVYDYSRENVFPGGSEYRYFDFKSLRHHSEYVGHIDFRDGNFHVALFPDKLRSSGTYFFHEDLNGKFYIDVQEQRDRNTDADYALVYFTLPYRFPPGNGSVYVFGGISNWELGRRNKMLHNPQTNSYELTLLLKQGFYNYEYVFIPDDNPVADNSLFEGNHYETENDYVIYVYHMDDTYRYEKLIAVSIANTLHKASPVRGESD